MRTRFSLSILILTALSGWPRSTHMFCAECVELRVCQAADNATIVFVGDVIDLGPVMHEVAPNTLKRGPQTVRFKVIERFRGLEPDQREITADIVGRSVESIFIESRGRYLVYAREVAKGQWDMTCSRTKAIQTSKDEEEIKELRACAKRPPG